MKHIFSLTLCLAGLAIVVNCQSDEKLVLDVYYSNSCPDSKRFITNQLPTLIDDFVTTNRMDINLVSFGKASVHINLTLLTHDHAVSSFIHSLSMSSTTKQACTISLVNLVMMNASEWLSR